jgi:uncharacterized metal-binding protein YceD (DUF177 family)
MKPTVTLEFSRTLIVDRVPRKGSHEVFAAEPKECVALSKRFSLPALHSLKAHLIAMPWRGGGLKVTGDVTIDMEQVSVISLERFSKTQKFKVERYFLPEKMIVDAAEDDVDPIENGEIDLGEIVAETVALELDPYPRKQGEAYADEAQPAAEIIELKPSPFAKLKKIIETGE